MHFCSSQNARRSLHRCGAFCTKPGVGEASADKGSGRKKRKSGSRRKNGRRAALLESINALLALPNLLQTGTDANTGVFFYLYAFSFIVDGVVAGAPVSATASIDSTKYSTNKRNNAAPTLTFQVRAVQESYQVLVSLAVAELERDS